MNLRNQKITESGYEQTEKKWTVKWNAFYATIAHYKKDLAARNKNVVSSQPLAALIDKIQAVIPLCIGYNEMVSASWLADVLQEIDQKSLSYKIFLYAKDKESLDQWYAENAALVATRKEHIMTREEWRATPVRERAKEIYNQYYAEHSEKLKPLLAGDSKKFLSRHLGFPKSEADQHVIDEVIDSLAWLYLNESSAEKKYLNILAMFYPNTPQLMENAHRSVQLMGYEEESVLIRVQSFKAKKSLSLQQDQPFQAPKLPYIKEPIPQDNSKAAIADKLVTKAFLLYGQNELTAEQAIALGFGACQYASQQEQMGSPQLNSRDQMESQQRKSSPRPIPSAHSRSASSRNLSPRTDRSYSSSTDSPPNSSPPSSSSSSPKSPTSFAGRERPMTPGQSLILNRNRDGFLSAALRHAPGALASNTQPEENLKSSDPESPSQKTIKVQG